jgi:methyltransferase (TIGR00027 family)
MRTLLNDGSGLTARQCATRSRRCGGHGLPSRASRTAALMAVQRGLESTRPTPQRLFEDPLARSFLTVPWRLALGASRFGPVRRIIETAYDLVAGPGPRASSIARTKLIDDTVEALAPSVDQVVVLGAGYDTRPYRLNCLSGHQVFEVDQAGTQAAKTAALRRAGTGLKGVAFVPVNFEIDNLGRALLDAGYRPEHPTLFLWEGVTQYLSTDAVDGTLSTIHDLAPMGGYVVFTYVDSAALDKGPSPFPEAGKWLREVNKRGEPWIFGVIPADLAGFLTQRGLRLLDDLSTAEAGARYFGPLGRRDRGSGLYHVAIAAIVPKEAVVPK